jgi:hypothetical protein
LITYKDNVPFQIWIRYPQRQPTERGVVYSSDNIGWPSVPVVVAYNLFSLEADKVIYDGKSQTIKASGNVVVDNASGTPSRADSAAFKIENGQALPIE